MHLFLAILTLAFAGLAGAADAQVAPAAQRILDRARGASGGPGWNALRGLHEVGVESGVRYERWIDPLRYGLRVEMQDAAGKHVRAFNGAAEWEIRPDGVVTGADDGPTLRRVRSETFFGAHGYFYPGRFDARGSLVGVRPAQGRLFDVVRLQPYGADPWELWFDRTTGLLDRAINPAGVTIEFSDYRTVAQVKVPYRTLIYGGGMPRLKTRVLETIDFPAADRDMFSLPPATAQAARLPLDRQAPMPASSPQ